MLYERRRRWFLHRLPALIQIEKGRLKTMPKILIIRPQNRAVHDVAVCEAAGWQAEAVSPLEIEADAAALAALPQQFAAADAVFWVSPSAVETAAPYLKDWLSDGLKPQVAVGKATQNALREQGFQHIDAPEKGNDSEAVAALPLWQTLPPQAKVLIVRGHGGRDFLARYLSGQGVQTEFAEVYFRRPKALNWHEIDLESADAAYITSRELVQEWFAQMPPQAARRGKTLLYFTHHPRIAEALEAAGAQNIRLIAALDAAVLHHVEQGASMSQPEDKHNQPTETPAENTAVPSENETRSAPAAAAAELPPPVQAAPVVIKQSSGKGLAAGALVLALLGLGASGFLFVQGQNVLKNQELAFSQKIDKAALGESENAALLKDNINRQTQIQAEIERLANSQRAAGEQIALNRQAYHELLKGRVNWLVDEAETMLNLATQQLLLSGNVQGAVGVLEHINNRLSRFDQPELLPIKQAVSSDLAALKSLPYVDISTTALRIDRLETAVSGLPLVVDGTLKPGEAQAAENEALSWWEKSLAALKGLVEVRRLDNNDAMLLAPEQVYFVRENLRLRLLDARTALLQHNGEVYQSDLNHAEAAVKNYFDNKSPATQSWLKELAELKALDVRLAGDDALKASLAAVRNYQDSARIQVNVAGNQAASEPVPAAEAAASEAAPTVLPQAPALPSESADKAEAKPEAAKEANDKAAKPDAAKDKPADKPASAAKGEAA